MNKIFPNTYIIGAPKCGTTSLVEYLRSHPDIYVPANKEPFYWSKDLNHVIKTTENEYLSNYKDVGDQKIVIDGSTTYCWSRRAIGEIRSNVKNAKFIYMIRNPVEMVFSWHSQLLSENSAIDQCVEKSWHEKATGGRTAFLGEKALDYRYVCSLGDHLLNIRKEVENHNLLVLVLDDLKMKPRETYLQVLNFLSLEDNGFNDFIKYNVHKVRVNNIFSMVSSIFTEPHNYKVAKYYINMKKRLGIKGFNINNILYNYYMKVGRERVEPSSFRQYLCVELLPQIEILERELSRDFSEWKK
jgi:hypothetical protein